MKTQKITFDLSDDAALLHLQNALVAGLLEAAPVSTEYTNATLAMAVWQILQVFRHVWPHVRRLQHFWEAHHTEYARLLADVISFDEVSHVSAPKDRWS